MPLVPLVVALVVAQLVVAQLVDSNFAIEIRCRRNLYAKTTGNC